MTVAAILKDKKPGVIAAKPGDSVEQVCQLLADKGIGAVLVLRPDGGIAGILSERDIVRGLSMIGNDLLQQSVDSIMTKNVMVCSSHDTIEDIMHLMTRRRIRHLPVVDDGELVGIVSIGDVVKRRIAQTEMEAEALKQYIATG
ncbi:MAG TPA: CBS domain-containing protein [Ferrovibrio sp.]|jgi:CBS domain-containing protein|uniref:CBS domain-containing protein n=1 Tax=Ferrovibrio sp. TaxID=1917215 RepID=UPI002B4B79B1|nr:CBS domain-containing protein [Ferrovibrio sp.]HLT78627.1 CBS domain-containing protein [Ferrovibrio sp.]